MEPDRKTSSPGGISYTLLSALAFLSGLWLANLRAPDDGQSKSMSPVDHVRQGQTAPTRKQANYIERRKRHTSLWTTLRESLSVLATVGLLLANVFLLASTKKAANAAKESADIAKKQLEMSERPWITIAFTVNRPLQFDAAGGMGVGLQIVTKNIGHSVATSVRPIVGAEVEGSGEFMKVFKAQKDMCETWRTVRSLPAPGNDQVTLFPQETYTENTTIGFSKDQIEKAQIGKGQITAVLVFGCVDYGFAFASDHHQTGFNYEVVRPTPSGEIGTLPIKVGENVPLSHLIIRRSIFGGFYVD